jgi:hypothetical protein
MAGLAVRLKIDLLQEDAEKIGVLQRASVAA